LIEKKAFAKINLALDIIGVLPDGMHEVDLILTPLTLADKLTFELFPGTNEIVLEAPEGLGAKTDNLVFRAAQLLQARFSVACGVRIVLDKQIPVAAGLAGGSSDAAATLQALIELWQLEVDTATLLGLAASLGADVPYCLYHETMRARGFGEQLSHVSPMMATNVILFKPKAYGIAARAAYTYVDVDKAFSKGHADKVEAMLTRGDYAGLCDQLYNGFESVLTPRFPDLAQHLATIRQLADGALISGSGPTIFAFAQNEQQVSDLLAYGVMQDLQTIQTKTKV
jgi:4-diphosphocytidyl-2-C-methyl-D-erythritol kinase